MNERLNEPKALDGRTDGRTNERTGLELGVGSDFGVGSGGPPLPTHVGSGML